jgi:DNA-binding XRE family transcriptional regulator
MSAQIIEKDGKPEFAVIPFEEYQALIAMAEDKSDEAAVLAFRESNDETFPASVVNALIAGESPIKVYRKHRKMTQQELADGIGKSKIYIGKLEAGDRSGSVDVLAKIAQALKIDLDDLTA